MLTVPPIPPDGVIDAEPSSKGKEHAAGAPCVFADTADNWIKILAAGALSSLMAAPLGAQCMAEMQSERAPAVVIA